MKFQIQPQDLQVMISQLNSFASDINNISSRMGGYASQLQAIWDDPQYQGFLISIEGMSRQFHQCDETLRNMAQQVDKLKQNLEVTHSDYNRMKY
jgi:archaellum component FlaC